MHPRGSSAWPQTRRKSAKLRVRLTKNAERAKARLEKNVDDVLITGCMREKERKRKKLGR